MYYFDSQINRNRGQVGEELEETRGVSQESENGSESESSKECENSNESSICAK